MQHSVNYIGQKYEELSSMRNDVKRFIAKDFFEFAKTNEKKYHAVENGDDLLVSSWYSGDLINDYRNSL